MQQKEKIMKAQKLNKYGRTKFQMMKMENKNDDNKRHHTAITKY